MALRATYSVSASSNVDISARIRAYQMSVMANAEQGSVAMPSLAVDDPEGGINITGLKSIMLTETAESSNSQVIFTGWTAAQEVTRGQDSHRTGAARLWTVTLADQNSLIGRRIMRGSDANRPAETDVARVQWLLTTTEFGSVVPSSRYVSTLYPVAMDAVDYRDQSNQQILDDCSQQSGKNYFVMYDEPIASYGLFYDFAGSSAYRSTIRLSNVLSDVDSSTTFAVSETDTKLNRDPSRVYSGVVLPYVGGEVYVESTSIGLSYAFRDTMAPSANVKTSAKATARANRYLGDAATEADVISTSFLVPLAKVNQLKEGMAVSCRFSHLPGYGTNFTWMRVLNRQVVATSEEWYTVTVEMATAVGGLNADGSPSAGWVCIPTDFSLGTGFDGGGGSAMEVIFPDHTNGQSAASPHVSNDDMFYVYNGALYSIDYFCYHAPESNFLTAFLVEHSTDLNIGSTPAPFAIAGSGSSYGMGDKYVRCSDVPNDIPAATRTWTSTITGYVYARLVEQSCAGGDSYASSLSVHMNYVSGPDPRYEGLPACSNGSPP
jgi:hypothetical protein